MQLSTTTIASRVVPSSSTRHLAWSWSVTLVAVAWRKPPLIRTGKVLGETSIADAPARRGGSPAAARRLDVAARDENPRRRGTRACRTATRRIRWSMAVSWFGWRGSYSSGKVVGKILIRVKRPVPLDDVILARGSHI